MHKYQFTCPFCFEKVVLDGVEHRCHNGWCPAGKEPDKKYQKYLGATSAVNLGHIVDVKPTAWDLLRLRTVACDKCGHPTLPICPHCHNTLPDTTISGRDNIISVVGTRSSGKSHYIAVLVNELQRRIAPALGASVQGFVDMSGAYNADAIYRRTKYDRLYGRQETLEMTQSNFTGVRGEDKQPLVYTFDYVGRKVARSNRFTLAFFDAAGEDLQDPHLMATVNRYLGHSAGIIFLVDPLQVPEVLSQVESASGHVSHSTGAVAGSSPDAVMANISALIRQSRGLKPTRPIDIPVAVAFSKFDEVEPIVPAGMTVRAPSPHCDAGAFSMSDRMAVDAEMRSLLASWGMQSFLMQAQANYRNYSFFAVSSLGLHNAPDSAGHVHRPLPHRMEDPLLWIMAENGLMRCAR